MLQTSDIDTKELDKLKNSFVQEESGENQGSSAKVLLPKNR